MKILRMTLICLVLFGTAIAATAATNWCSSWGRPTDFTMIRRYGFLCRKNWPL
jgi:uncharacterized protein (DUF697 family)